MSKGQKLPNQVVTADVIIDEIAATVKDNGQLIDRIIDDVQSIDRGVAKLTAVIKSNEEN